MDPADPVPADGTGGRPDEGPPADSVHIQAITCGRCGWPNACRVQRGMRALRFLCTWCNQMTTGIVDPSLKRNVIF